MPTENERNPFESESESEESAFQSEFEKAGEPRERNVESSENPFETKPKERRKLSCSRILILFLGVILLIPILTLIYAFLLFLYWEFI